MYAPTASLSLIVASAAISEAREEEEHLLSRGIGVVYKPFDIEDFLENVRQSLQPRLTRPQAAPRQQAASQSS